MTEKFPRASCEEIYEEEVFRVIRGEISVNRVCHVDDTWNGEGRERHFWSTSTRQRKTEDAEEEQRTRNSGPGPGHSLRRLHHANGTVLRHCDALFYSHDKHSVVIATGGD